MTATIPPPDSDIVAPNWAAPAGACDCHFHIFGPPDRYPYGEPRGYTPPDALIDAYRAMADTLGLQRAVVVNPSVYGTNNACSLQAVRDLGPGGRGVAVIDSSIGDAELAELHAAGFRGARFNLFNPGGAPRDALGAVAERIASLGWHLQFYCHPDEMTDLAALAARLPCQAVFDHFAGMRGDMPVSHPGFQTVLGLAREGRAWVKVSGAYRVDHGAPPWPAAAPLFKALAEAAPTQLVWGTDWPHPAPDGPMPKDGDLFNLLGAWTNDAGLRQAILVDNPARLYDFD